MIKETKYTCEICRVSYESEKACMEHERSCNKTQYLKKWYQDRVECLSKNLYLFYAKSEEDLDNCMILRFNSSVVYEKINFPCIVLIEEDETGDNWDEDITYLHYFVQPLDKYLNKINKIKEMLLEEDCKGGR